jgi:hypothetical protein
VSTLSSFSSFIPFMDIIFLIYRLPQSIQTMQQMKHLQHSQMPAPIFLRYAMKWLFPAYLIFQTFKSSSLRRIAGVPRPILSHSASISSVGYPRYLFVCRISALRCRRDWYLTTGNAGAEYFVSRYLQRDSCGGNTVGGVFLDVCLFR